MRFRNFALLGVVSAFIGMLTKGPSSDHALEPDALERGRYAASPHSMTALGWKDVLFRTWTETWDDRLMSVAAGVAFFAILALAPAITVLISIYGLLTDLKTVQAQIAPLYSILPGAAVDVIRDQAERIASKPPETLSLRLGVGLAIALWSSNAGMKALFEALNVIYDEQEKRSFLKLNAVSLLVTISAVLFIIVSLTFIASAPVILRYSPFSAQVEWLVTLLRWPVFFLISTMAIAALYWIGPSRRRAKFRWVIPGALFAALMLAAVSAGFSYYVSMLGNYEATYGSLSTVIVFLTWLWLSAMIVLIGAELNSELEHQTTHDTTMGTPKPLGKRGAAMADRIGPRT